MNYEELAQLKADELIRLIQAVPQLADYGGMDYDIAKYSALQIVTNILENVSFEWTSIDLAESWNNLGGEDSYEFWEMVQNKLKV